MTQHEKLFESLPPTRLFFRCALPSMISMAMLSLYTVADGIFVGALCGPQRSGGGQSGDAADHDEFRTGGPGGGGVLRSDLYPPWGKK